MTKSEAKRLSAKYNMQLIRNDITREATAYILDTQILIPELDAHADKISYRQIGHNETVCKREAFADTYRYTIPVNSGWIDLWGDWA